MTGFPGGADRLTGVARFAPFAGFTGIARSAEIVIRTTSSVCNPSAAANPGDKSATPPVETCGPQSTGRASAVRPFAGFSTRASSTLQKFPWGLVVIPAAGKIVIIGVKPPPKSGCAWRGVGRNKYEYFGSCRSAGVKSASPSSADIPRVAWPAKCGHLSFYAEENLLNRLDFVLGCFFPLRMLGGWLFL